MRISSAVLVAAYIPPIVTPAAITTSNENIRSNKAINGFFGGVLFTNRPKRTGKATIHAMFAAFRKFSAFVVYVDAAETTPTTKN